MPVRMVFRMTSLPCTSQTAREFIVNGAPHNPLFSPEKPVDCTGFAVSTGSSSTDSHNGDDLPSPSRKSQAPTDWGASAPLVGIPALETTSDRYDGGQVTQRSIWHSPC